MKHVSLSCILRSYLWCITFAVLACAGLAYAADPPEGAGAGEAPQEEGAGVVLGPSAEELWQKANTLLQDGDQEEASKYFYTVFKRFPEDVNAAASLWNTAEIGKKLALKSKDADWERIRNFYRLYINYFPTERNVDAAYLELGKAHYYMRLYREAISYFKLFLNTYPNSPLALEARRWLGQVLLKIGHTKEAEKVFRDLMKDPDKDVQVVGFIGMGDLHYINKEYREAKDYFQMVVINAPNYYLKDPQILRKAGLANIAYGKTARGRKQLYHYLSLDGYSTHKLEVLFALGESYLAEKNYGSAQKIYKQVIEQGEKNDKEVLFSQLRLAQFLDNPALKLSKWQRPNDLRKTEGDAPYLAILDKYYNAPLAQDARYGLFLRYKARGELDRAYSSGRDFLRNAGDDGGRSVSNERVGVVLLHLTEEFLKTKRYQDMYDLYYVEYRHVKDYPDGTILYRVGQALEALNLYDKAAVVYYRAMKWPLTDEEKIDLYSRRSRVYLALQDYQAADRLLTHLRKTYAGTKSIGEVEWYSGKLYEALGEDQKALGFYAGAVREPTFADKLSIYTDDALRLFLKLGQESAAYVVLQGAVKKGLAPDVAQEWILKIGDGMRQKSQCTEAIPVYTAGLQETYPLESNQAQAINLYLGDCYYNLGEKAQGIEYYTKAKEGKSAFWSKMAEERLAQDALKRDLAEIKKVSGQ